jgi:hypothetical protein
MTTSIKGPPTVFIDLLGILSVSATSRRIHAFEGLRGRHDNLTARTTTGGGSKIQRGVLSESDRFVARRTVERRGPCILIFHLTKAVKYM